MGKHTLMCPAVGMLWKTGWRIRGFLPLFSFFFLFNPKRMVSQWVKVLPHYSLAKFHKWVVQLRQPSRKETLSWGSSKIFTLPFLLGCCVFHLSCSLVHAHGRRSMLSTVICFLKYFFAWFIFCKYAPCTLLLQWQRTNPEMMNCTAALWQLLLFLNSHAFSSCGVLWCFTSPILSELTDAVNKLLHFN